MLQGRYEFFGQGIWMRGSKQIRFLRSPLVRPHPQLKWVWRSTHLQWLPVQWWRQGAATRHCTHSFLRLELFCSSCQYGDVWERSGFCGSFCRWNPLRILGGNSCSFRKAGAESVTPTLPRERDAPIHQVRCKLYSIYSILDKKT